ncbi:hypothetical protein FQA39_LY18317 [Lamprigera yunnana]|nr:hypothetical protein FQA39_LY18317 [Lamprigera yunnana]
MIKGRRQETKRSCKKLKSGITERSKLAQNHVIKISNIVDYFKDEKELIAKGENSVESGHVEKMMFDLNLHILKGVVHASMCVRQYKVELISNMSSTLRGKHLHAQAREMAFNVYQSIKSQNEDQCTKEIKEKVSRATGVYVKTIERIIKEGSTSPEAETDKRFKSPEKKTK